MCHIAAKDEQFHRVGSTRKSGILSSLPRVQCALVVSWHSNGILCYVRETGYVCNTKQLEYDCPNIVYIGKLLPTNCQSGKHISAREPVPAKHQITPLNCITKDDSSSSGHPSLLQLYLAKLQPCLSLCRTLEGKRAWDFLAASKVLEAGRSYRSGMRTVWQPLCHRLMAV